MPPAASARPHPSRNFSARATTNRPTAAGCLTRRLRADPRTRAAHIHCLSGSGEPASREQASRAGCEEFLAKPLDAAALLRVVRRDVDRAEPRWVSGLTKAEAEDLLDWLEANGYPPAELSLREDGFAARCPGLRESPP
jgi:DNA-binding response OmpR family regulator